MQTPNLKFCSLLCHHRFLDRQEGRMPPPQTHVSRWALSVSSIFFGSGFLHPKLLESSRFRLCFGLAFSLLKYPASGPSGCIASLTSCPHSPCQWAGSGFPQISLPRQLPHFSFCSSLSLLPSYVSHSQNNTNTEARWLLWFNFILAVKEKAIFPMSYRFYTLPPSMPATSPSPSSTVRLPRWRSSCSYSKANS